MTIFHGVLVAAFTGLLASMPLTAPKLIAHAAPAGVKNIVLVHGTWADGSSWAKVIPLLQAKGYHVTAVKTR